LASPSIIADRSGDAADSIASPPLAGRQRAW
jgi:hypothetical protein